MNTQSLPRRGFGLWSACSKIGQFKRSQTSVVARPHFLLNPCHLLFTESHRSHTLRPARPAQNSICGMPKHCRGIGRGHTFARSFVLSAVNCQSTSDKLSQMRKSTASRNNVASVSSRPFRTTVVHLPSDLWELLNRVAFERARTKGGRASVSALLVEMIERNVRYSNWN